MTFTKKTENFTCKHCGHKVKGNGFTNHCPKCLYSRHVDVWPGDRKEECGGLMEPVGMELKNEKYILTHRCLVCGKETHCKASNNDSIDALTKLSEKLVKKTFF